MHAGISACLPGRNERVPDERPGSPLSPTFPHEVRQADGLARDGFNLLRLKLHRLVAAGKGRPADPEPVRAGLHQGAKRPAGVRARALDMGDPGRHLPRAEVEQLALVAVGAGLTPEVDVRKSLAG